MPVARGQAARVGSMGWGDAHAAWRDDGVCTDLWHRPVARRAMRARVARAKEAVHVVRAWRQLAPDEGHIQQRHGLPAFFFTSFNAINSLSIFK